MLQGGVSQNNYVGGSGGGGLAGATPWGALIQEIGKHRDAARQGFSELANNMSNNALAASMSNVSFNPNMAQMPQMGYVQPSTGGNLFNYLAR